MIYPQEELPDSGPDRYPLIIFRILRDASSKDETSQTLEIVGDFRGSGGVGRLIEDLEEC